MKLFTVALFASSFTSVLASGRVAGWEAVTFYYAYLMDVRTGGDAIGPGCKGTHKTIKGACNFPEFIDHIQFKPYKRRNANGQREQFGGFDPSKVPSSLRDLDFPDPEEASNIMEWEGSKNPSFGFGKPGQGNTIEYYKFTGAYVNAELVKAADGDDNHKTILKRVANRVQDARARDTDGKTSADFDKVKECLKVVRAGRMADNLETLPKVFQDKILKKANTDYIKDEQQYLKVSYTETNIDGFKFQDFDVDKIINDIEKHPKLTTKQVSELRDLVVEYVLNYDKRDELSTHEGSGGKVHNEIVMDIEDIQSKLAGDPSVYCTV